MSAQSFVSSVQCQAAVCVSLYRGAALAAAVCWPNLTNLSSVRAGPQPQPRQPSSPVARLESCLAAGQPSVVATPASASPPTHTEAARTGEARPGEVVIMQKYLPAMQKGTDHILPQSRGLSSVKTRRSRRVLVSETMNHGPVCASTVHMLFDNGFNYKLVSYCQPGHTPVPPSGDNTLISTR